MSPSASFRDLYKPFLKELCRSRHGIRVDLDAGKQVFVSPFMNFRGRAAQLNLHTAFHQVGDEPLVGITARYAPFGVVGLVVQRHMARLRVKDRNNLRRGRPSRQYRSR